MHAALSHRRRRRMFETDLTLFWFETGGERREKRYSAAIIGHASLQS